MLQNASKSGFCSSSSLRKQHDTLCKVASLLACHKKARMPAYRASHAASAAWHGPAFELRGAGQGGGRRGAGGGGGGMLV